MSSPIDHCVFCKIIQGKLPASIAYEDKYVLAIMDIQPSNSGHVLVLPKQHYQFLHDVPYELGHKLMTTVQRIDRALRQVEGIRCEGTNILQNNGRSAWQEVPHVHFHIIPRYAGDQLKIKLPSQNPSREVLDDLAARVGERV